MTAYVSEAQATQDGFLIEHREPEHRFVVTLDGEVVGYAHYTLSGDERINFDGTFMDPAHRGVGLSALLVAHALAHEVTRNKHVQASCWYVADYIVAHPDALAEGASFTG